jgi:DNA-binding FrmR family transcriptional regulator
MRDAAMAVGSATLVAVLVVGLVLFTQISGIRGEVNDLAASVEGGSSTEAILDDIRAVDSRLDSLETRLEAMSARFDRIDASIAELPTETENRSQIGSILAEVQALQQLLSGLSLDLGIVCDVVGC